MSFSPSSVSADSDLDFLPQWELKGASYSSFLRRNRERAAFSFPEEVFMTEVFDLRTSKTLFVKSTRRDLPKGIADVAVALQLDQQQLQEVPLTVRSCVGYIIDTHVEDRVGDSNTMDKYIIIHTEHKGIYCVRVNCTTTEEQICSHLNTILYDKNSQNTAFLLCYCECRISVDDIVFSLSTGAEVEVFTITPVTWNIIYRPSFHLKMQFTLHTLNTDPLGEMKRMFLRRYGANACLSQDIDIDQVWFLSHDKVLTDKDIVQAATYSSRRKLYTHPFQVSPYLESSAHVEKHEFAIFVHFQPPDAVVVTVVFQPDPNKTAKANSKLVVPPQISKNELRNEVSKVAGIPLAGLKVIIDRKKLNSKLDLRKALTSPNCTIKADRASEISVYIQVIKMAQSVLTYTHKVYPYELLDVLKQSVCHHVTVKPHCVDVFNVNGEEMTESLTLKDNGIKDNDKILFHVLPNRVCLRVRTPGRGWIVIIVDDPLSTSLGDVKRFGLQIEGSCQDEHAVAMLWNNKFLCEVNTLGEIGILPARGVTRLIMVRVQSVLFTVSTAYERKFVLYQDTGKGWFRTAIVMTDGRKLFYEIGTDSASAEDVQELLLQRSRLTRCVHIKGIKLCSDNNFSQFSLRPASTPLSTQGARQTSCFISSSCTLTSTGTQTIVTEPTQRSYPGEKISVDGEFPSQEQEWRSEECRRLKENRSHVFNSVNLSEQALHSKMTINEPEMSPSSITTVDAPKAAVATTVQSDSVPVCSVPSSVTAHHSISYPGDLANAVSRKRSSPRAGNVGSSGHDFDGAEGHRRRKVSRRTLTSEHLHENANGTWTHIQSSESETSMLPDTGEQEYSNLMQPSSSYTQRSMTCTGAVASLAHCNSIVSTEPCYKCNVFTEADEPGTSCTKDVSKAVLATVAYYLGSEGMMVMRELGVADRDIQQAIEEHQHNAPERFMSCLKAWCKKAGSQANKQILVNALTKYDRNDIIEWINDNDDHSNGNLTV